MASISILQYQRNRRLVVLLPWFSAPAIHDTAESMPDCSGVLLGGIRGCTHVWILSATFSDCFSNQTSRRRTCGFVHRPSRRSQFVFATEVDYGPTVYARRCPPSASLHTFSRSARSCAVPGPGAWLSAGFRSARTLSDRCSMPR